MGSGSSSEAKTSVHTKNVVESFSKAIQNCQSGASFTQRINITGNNNYVGQVRLVQGFKLNADCALTDESVAETQQKVASAIKQATDSQTDSITGAFSSSNSKTASEILNETKTVINKETIANIVSDFNLLQELNVNGNSNIVQDITMEQTLDALAGAVTKVLNKIQSFQDIQTQADQAAKSTQQGIIAETIKSVGTAGKDMGQAVSSVASSFGMIYVIIICVGMVVGAWVLINGGPFGKVFGGLGSLFVVVPSKKKKHKDDQPGAPKPKKFNPDGKTAQRVKNSFLDRTNELTSCNGLLKNTRCTKAEKAIKELINKTITSFITAFNNDNKYVYKSGDADKFAEKVVEEIRHKFTDKIQWNTDVAKKDVKGKALAFYKEMYKSCQELYSPTLSVDIAPQPPSESPPGKQGESDSPPPAYSASQGESSVQPGESDSAQPGESSETPQGETTSGEIIAAPPSKK